MTYSEKNLGELEQELNSKKDSRDGGIYTIILNLALIVLVRNHPVFYWIFGATLTIFAVATYSIHNDIQEIRDQIKKKLELK